MTSRSSAEPVARWASLESYTAEERGAALDFVRDMLTMRQYCVMRDVFVHEMPIEVVAERHHVCPSSIYRVLQRARQRMMRALMRRRWNAMREVSIVVGVD
jgi:predicted DNA-binding protein (UPF0251 family)